MISGVSVGFGFAMPIIPAPIGLTAVNATLRSATGARPFHSAGGVGGCGKRVREVTMTKISLVNATVIDGSGADPFTATIDVADDRIVAVRRDPASAGARPGPGAGDPAPTRPSSTAPAAP